MAAFSLKAFLLSAFSSASIFFLSCSAFISCSNLAPAATYNEYTSIKTWLQTLLDMNTTGIFLVKFPNALSLLFGCDLSPRESRSGVAEVKNWQRERESLREFLYIIGIFCTPLHNSNLEKYRFRFCSIQLSP